MKNIIFYIIFLFITLVILGSLIDYAYSLWKGTAFEIPVRKFVFYAVFSIVFGIWRGRKLKG